MFRILYLVIVGSLAKGGNGVPRDTRLLKAIENGQFGEVERLTRSGRILFIKTAPEVNLKTSPSIREDYLIDASRVGHREIVELLVARGANVNAIGSGGWTPLLRASEKGHRDVVELLLTRGADVNLLVPHKMTALHWAAAAHHNEIVEMLLAHGARINARNDERETPLRWESKFGGNFETCELLVSRGADVDWEDIHGLTPLILAAGQDRRDVAEMFLAHGANVNLANRKGETPLKVALKNGREEMAKILIAHGARDSR